MGFVGIVDGGGGGFCGFFFSVMLVGFVLRFGFFFFLDNYTLPTCGLPLILCAYPWFKF